MFTNSPRADGPRRYNDISTGDDGIAIKAGACGDSGHPNGGGALQGGPTPLQCVSGGFQIRNINLEQVILEHRL